MTPPTYGTHPCALLIDVMGTVVFDPFYACVPGFFDMSFEQLIREKHPTAWVDFELGAIDEATFLPRFFQDERPYDHLGLKETMRANYAWLLGMERLVSDIAAARVPMHALSNYTPWYHMIEERTGLSRFVQWSFVSCDTGVRKPNPAAYLSAAKTLRQPPSECLFIDDRKHNCDAAVAVGMPAILFEDADQLRTELVHRGVLSS